jgi:RNA-directed DNA polymerase
MPRTVDHLMELIREPDNIYRAIHQVQQGKDTKKEMLDFTFNYMDSFKKVSYDLNHLDELDLGYVRKFIVHEPKERDVNAPIITERVMHHCLGQILFPIMKQRFSPRSFACIPSELSQNFRMIPKNQRLGKGVLSACCQIQHDMNKALQLWKKPWVVYVDIQKYFPSIDHDVLKYFYRRIVADKEVLFLLDAIIDSFDSDCQFVQIGHKNIYKTIPSEKDFVHGRPIGYLTSQWDGNLVLNSVDHLVMDELGMKFYTRYMDDLRIICESKMQCEDVLGKVDEFCKFKLRLKVHPVKTKILPLSERIPFCAYVIDRDRMFCKHSTARRTDRRLEHLKSFNPDKVRPSLNSFLGYMKWCEWDDLAIKAVTHTGIPVDFENRRII